MLHLKVEEMAALVRRRELSSVDLVRAHIERIKSTHERLNAAVLILEDSALAAARAADDALARGIIRGPLHGVPFSVKDSMEVAGTRCTAGTLGFREACVSERDAEVVRRLRAAGGIPIVKTNLPDLLFSFESDNLIFGRTNNPHDASRTSGGSSGGEAALIAVGGSPLGLGSDCAGSVRVPAAFCGIASIKPTTGRIPRTGHVPPAGGWVERLWQIGPMARSVDDLVLAMRLLAGEDGFDLTAPPVPLDIAEHGPRKIALFTDNGIAKCQPEVVRAVQECGAALERSGIVVEVRTPPRIEECYELELALLGADGGDGIDAYLKEIGSDRVHPLLTNFVDRMRPHRMTGAEFAKLWARWDSWRADMQAFFRDYDAVLSPVYTQAALPHHRSMHEENFRGFSYTMAWNVAGFPAATVPWSESGGLPINVQVIARPWRDMHTLELCMRVEQLAPWRASEMIQRSMAEA